MDKSFSNFVPSCSDVKTQRRCQQSTNAFGGVGTLGIDSAIRMTMQPSLTTMKIVTACEQALHLRDIERRHARVARERRRGSKVRGKKVKVLRFLRPSRLRLLLACSLATRNGEGAPSP